MEFKNGDIVSHTSSLDKFYIVLEDHKNGQYLVEDCDVNFFGIKERYVFMGKYLLTKKDRRDYVLQNILIKRNDI